MRTFTKSMLSACALMLALAPLAQAQNQACMIDHFGDLYDMTYTPNGSGHDVVGTAFWDFAGTYTFATKTLSIDLTNPSPDGCTELVDALTFDVTRQGIDYIGTYTQYCFGDVVFVGDLTLRARRGACNPVGPQREGSPLAGLLRKGGDVPFPAGFGQDVFEAPEAFTLSQNYPNPFNPTTNISYTLNDEASVTLRIFNTLGQEVRTLVSTQQQAGAYTVTWDGTDNAGAAVASGVYLYRLDMGDASQTYRMTLIK